MKLRIGEILHGIDGLPIRKGPKDDDGYASLGDICVQALTSDSRQDESEPGNKKFHRWQLARRIQKELREGVQDSALAIDVPVEDVEVIKKRIAMAFTTKILGPAFEIIESQD